MKKALIIILVLVSFNVKGQKTGSFTDPRDGKTYKTVEINGKTWMAENLNYEMDKKNSFCYENDERNCNTYGRLYTLHAAKKACPTGWHLPSAKEFNDLTKSVGHNNYKLKEAGDKHWEYNSYSTNSTGFTALPGGYLYGQFRNLGTAANFWTSESAGYETYYYVHFKSSNAKSYFEKEHNYGWSAFSVRCVKD